MPEQAAEKYYLRRGVTSAAEADVANTPFIAALKRCATQNQMLQRVFPQAVTACPDTNRASAARLGLRGIDAIRATSYPQAEPAPSLTGVRASVYPRPSSMSGENHPRWSAR